MPESKKLDKSSSSYLRGWSEAWRYHYSIDRANEAGVRAHTLPNDEWVAYMQGMCDTIKIREDFNRDDGYSLDTFAWLLFDKEKANT